MAGDVVLRAVEIGGGKFDSDSVLKWLADIVRTLRTTPTAACGAAGHFYTTEETGTVEINPTSRLPSAGLQRRALGFTASDAINAVVTVNAITDEGLKLLVVANDDIATAFSQALAAELILGRRAAIGNFGVWTIGHKPNLTRFVRFRPRPEINHML